MSSPYTPNGLVDLDSVNPNGRSRYTTFPGRQNQTAPTSIMSAPSLMPVPSPSVPLPNHAFSVPLPGPTGLMAFPENVPTRVYASSNPYAGLELSPEAYARASWENAEWMLEHPYEETWKYKFGRALEATQRFIWRMKQKVMQISRPIVIPVCRGLESCLDCAAEFCEPFALGYGAIRYQIYADFAVITGIDLV